MLRRKSIDVNVFKKKNKSQIIHGSLTFNKGATQFNGKRRIFSTNGAGTM